MMSADPGPPEPAVRWLDRKERRGLRPRDAASVIIVVWLAAIVVFGIVEHLVDADTFPTVWLGMWWALETVTTVGYGDVVPESTSGRIIGAFLLLGGLALLSVVTATITSSFVARRQRDEPREIDHALLAEVRELRRRVEELHAAGTTTTNDPPRPPQADGDSAPDRP
jgi:voltage-gated potassium channel